MTATELDRTVKSQNVRLLDVFFLGPLMTIGGLMLIRRGRPLVGLTLGTFGFTTVLYNYRNWGVIREQMRRERQQT